MPLSTIFRILGWIFFSYIYLILIISTYGILLIIFIPLFVLSNRAFNIDLKRERKANDNFKDNNLFFRYGYRINRTDFSIPVDINWSDQKLQNFVSDMTQQISIKVNERLQQRINFKIYFKS